VRVCLPFVLLLRGWTADVVLFTNARLAVPQDMRERIEAAVVRIETRPIARLVARGARIAGIELATAINLELTAELAVARAI
jgi:hypothetical protein